MIRNLNRHQRRRRRLHRNKSVRRPFVLEAIEPRILLSADPTHFLGLLSDADGNDMMLQGSPGDRFGQGTLTLLDNAGAPVWTDPLRGVDEDAAFGWAVLNAGDRDGDNVEDFFVSAPGEGAGKGEVSLRSGADGTQLLSFEGVDAGDRFGSAVANVGDVDGDGVEDFAIGSPGAKTSSGASVGGVSLLSGAWLEAELAGSAPDPSEQYLGVFVNETLEIGAGFGSEITAAGDLLDGVNGVVGGEFYVGAPDGAHGRIDLLGFTLDDAGEPALDTRAYFQTDEPYYVDARSGSALQAINDVDGDGTADLLVGAPEAFDGGGTVAILSGSFFTRQVTDPGASPVDGDDVIWSMAGSEDAGFAGAVVATISDHDLDGVDDLLFTSPGEGHGAARVLSSTLTAMMTFEGPASFDETGQLSGDVEFSLFIGQGSSREELTVSLLAADTADDGTGTSTEMERLVSALQVAIDDALSTAVSNPGDVTVGDAGDGRLTLSANFDLRVTVPDPGDDYTTLGFLSGQVKGAEPTELLTISMPDDLKVLCHLGAAYAGEGTLGAAIQTGVVLGARYHGRELGVVFDGADGAHQWGGPATAAADELIAVRDGVIAFIDAYEDVYSDGGFAGDLPIVNDALKEHSSFLSQLEANISAAFEEALFTHEDFEDQVRHGIFHSFYVADTTNPLYGILSPEISGPGDLTIHEIPDGPDAGSGIDGLEFDLALHQREVIDLLPKVNSGDSPLILGPNMPFLTGVTVAGTLDVVLTYDLEFTLGIDLSGSNATNPHHRDVYANTDIEVLRAAEPWTIGSTTNWFDPATTPVDMKFTWPNDASGTLQFLTLDFGGSPSGVNSEADMLREVNARIDAALAAEGIPALALSARLGHEDTQGNRKFELVSRAANIEVTDINMSGLQTHASGFKGSEYGFDDEDITLSVGLDLYSPEKGMFIAKGYVGPSFVSLESWWPEDHNWVIDQPMPGETQIAPYDYSHPETGIGMKIVFDLKGQDDNGESKMWARNIESIACNDDGTTDETTIFDDLSLVDGDIRGAVSNPGIPGVPTDGWLVDLVFRAKFQPYGMVEDVVDPQGTGVGGVDDIMFPEFQADLNFEWYLGGGIPDDDPDTDDIEDNSIRKWTEGALEDIGRIPYFAADNIGVHLGTLLTSITKPILQVSNVLLAPFEPFLDFIYRDRLPIISDLRGEDTTLYDVASWVNGLVPDNPFSTLIQFILEMGRMRNDLQKLDDLGDIDNLLLVMWKSYELPGASDMRSMAEVSEMAINGGEWIDGSLGGGDFFSSLSGPALDGATHFFSSNSDRSSVIEFPIFTDPSEIINLMFGGADATLVKVNFPSFSFDASIGMDFPIFPPFLNVGFDGGVAAEMNFSLGYDTYGIRQFAASAKAGGPTDAGDLLNGLYLDDHGAGANDQPEIRLSATLVAKGYAGIPGLVEAGVRGGVTGEIIFDLNDSATTLPGDEGHNDGKVRANEFLDTLAMGAECVFDVSGDLKAFLEAYVWVGLDLWLVTITIFEDSWSLAEVTIFDFSHSCNFGGPPELGKIVEIDGENVLQLHAGPDAGLRAGPLPGEEPFNGGPEGMMLMDGPEYFEVDLVTETEEVVAGQFEEVDYLQVQWRGFKQKFDPANVDRIEFQGGGNFDHEEMTTVDMKDQFFVTKEVPARINVDFYGDFKNGSGHHAGDDIAVIENGGNVFMHGGPGNDLLQTRQDPDPGYGMDTIYGGVGSDTLEGGGGADLIYAAVAGLATNGGGGDKIKAGGGNDTVHGGDGDDSIWGGLGDDLLYGLDLSAGSTADGHDRISGDAGNDTLWGNSGDDTLSGNAGEDLLQGEAGDDQLYGEQLYLDEEDAEGLHLLGLGQYRDVLYGGDDQDLLAGGLHDDYLVGNEGDDILFGGQGSLLLDDLLLPKVTSVLEPVLYTAEDPQTIAQNEMQRITLSGDVGVGYAGDLVLKLQTGPGEDATTVGVAYDEDGEVFRQNVEDALNAALQEDGSDTPVSVSLLASGDSGYIPNSGGLRHVLEVNFQESFAARPVFQLEIVTDGTADPIGVVETRRNGFTPFAVGEQVHETLTEPEVTLRVDENGDAILDADGELIWDPVYRETNGDVALDGEGVQRWVPIAVQAVDADGNLMFDSNGVPVSELDEYGEIVPQTEPVFTAKIERDANGDPVLDSAGMVIVITEPVYVLDANGDPVLDENGDPIQEMQGVPFVPAGGRDSVYGSGGDDLLFGDNGEVLDGAEVNEETGEVTGGNAITAFYALHPATGGDDLLVGGGGNDSIIGGPGSDELYGDLEEGSEPGDGNDLLAGDFIEARWDPAAGVGFRVNSNFAGQGADDLLYGRGGDDTLIGGDGIDPSWGQDGDDFIFGDGAWLELDDAGEVSLFGTHLNDSGASEDLYGEAGDDVIFGGVGADTVYGDSGDDYLFGDHALVTVAAGLRSVVLDEDSAGGPDLMYGSTGDDELYGGTEQDSIRGQEGDDTLHGNKGDDFLFGDEGEYFFSGELLTRVDGTIVTEGGDDWIEGNEGNDTIVGAVGDDVLHGGNAHAYTSGPDRDVVFGDFGIVERESGESDVSGLSEMSGFNTQVYSELPGQVHHDEIYGEDGKDSLFGGSGNDTLDGGSGEDVVFGDHGIAVSTLGEWVLAEPRYLEVGSSDTARGGAGDDVIFGGVGDSDEQGDHVDGGGGDDIVSGDFGHVHREDEVVIAIDQHPWWIGEGDELAGGLGDDWVFGGRGSDIAYGGDWQGTEDSDESDRDLVIGDFVNLIYPFPGGQMLHIESLHWFPGEADELHGGPDKDSIIGGAGDDGLYGDQGDDHMMADWGFFWWSSPMVLDEMRTQDISPIDVPNSTSNTLRGGAGVDVMVGGIWSDEMHGDGGDDFLFSDAARFEYHEDGRRHFYESRMPNVGEGDVLTGGAGDDIAIGGKGSDVLSDESGWNYMVGDNGRIDFAEDDSIAVVESTDPYYGEPDTITGGSGRDHAYGGLGDDVITLFGDRDVAFGDGGRVEVIHQVVDRIQVTDPAFGGDDTIDGGSGNDTLLGGHHDDEIHGDSGSDLIFGDHGAIHFEDGYIRLIEETDHGQFGDDFIDGGSGSDSIYPGGGNNTVINANASSPFTGGTSSNGAGAASAAGAGALIGSRHASDVPGMQGMQAGPGGNGPLAAGLGARGGAPAGGAGNGAGAGGNINPQIGLQQAAADRISWGVDGAAKQDLWMNQVQAQRAAEIGSEDLSRSRRAAFLESGASDPGLDPQLEVQRSVVEDLRWDFDAAIKAGEWSILLDSLESGFGAGEEDKNDADESVLSSILARLKR